MYDTPDTVSENSWRTVTPPNQQTQNITNDALFSYLENLKPEDLINWIKTNATDNQYRRNLIGELLYREIIKVRTNSEDAAKIVNNILNLPEEELYNIFKDLKDNIVIFVEEYDRTKIAEVFNNGLNINQQNWTDAMEPNKVSPKSKSPTKDGDITNAFENLKGKASK